MAIVTFWSNGKGETAKTLSVSAIATYMAIEHNYKILLISTEHNDDTLETCYWEPKKTELINQINQNKTDISSGIDGLAKLIGSNKLTSNDVTNYTKLVFPGHRLEILTGSKTPSYQEYERIRDSYKEVIKIANEFYDFVFVDLDKGLNSNYIKDILKISDLVIVNITQRLKMIEDFERITKENSILKKDNVMLLIGRYDKYSKYNAKNVARTLGYKGEVMVVPYSTLFFEACNEGKIADFFLRFRKISNNDRNAIFIKEIQKATQTIIGELKFRDSIN